MIAWEPWIFTEEVEKYIPPKKGQKHVLRVIRELLAYEPRHRRTSLPTALRYLNNVIRKKCVVFLISDFQDTNYESPLRTANQRHDLIALAIEDPREKNLPAVGLVRLLDPETDEITWVDTSVKRVRESYRQIAKESVDIRNKIFRRNRIGFVEISTDRPYEVPLIQFFRRRALRMR